MRFEEHGYLCEAKLPLLPRGMVRRVEINAAASFWGYTDEWPDAETTTYVSAGIICYPRAGKRPKINGRGDRI